MKQYLKGLNNEQFDAVQHKTGPCLVLAGPGTGKTTVITARTCELISNKVVKPENILVVTFSKAAADEMKARFNKLSADAGIVDTSGITFGTFHSVFFRILRQYRGYSLENLIDETQKFGIIKSIIKKLDIDFFEDEDQISDLLNEIGYFINTMQDIESFQSSTCKKESFSRIFENYIETKHKAGKFDYDDMLIECYYLLKNSKNVQDNVKEKYKYLLIDEFQDINKVQYETIKLMAGVQNNVFAVGDDDQSIYGFRGATPMIMLDFEKEFKGCKRITLRNNYRSTNKILNTALSLINKNKLRYEKNLNAIINDGTPPIKLKPENFEAEAKEITEIIIKKVKDAVKFSDIAIIYRTNIQARALVDGFMDRNIPFVAVDGIMSVYNHWIYKDISSYLKLVYNSNDNDLLIRILNKPKRYISRMNIERASKIQGNIIDNLICYCGLNQLQINALEELRINISRMLSMSTVNAVRYIRNNIGYDEYLREYSYGKGIGIEGLFEVIEEIEEAAGNFANLKEFLNHVDEVSKELGRKAHKGDNKNRVQLMTMHRAKGLEFKLVFIAGAVEGLSPYKKSSQESEKQLEEERRLFYVALTRAKQELYVSSPQNRYGKKVEPSRFIDEMIDINKIAQNEVEVGKKIYHKIFEEGIITDILNAKGANRILVNFKNGKKELDVFTCIKNGIVRFL